MKTTLIITAAIAAAFATGFLASCSPSMGGQAPDSVVPVGNGSYTISGAK